MGSVGTTYAGGAGSNAIQYAPQGAIEQMKLGNNLVEWSAYNSRLQPIAINLGISGSNPPSVRALEFTYAPTETPAANNGSVRSQKISGAGAGFIGDGRTTRTTA